MADRPNRPAVRGSGGCSSPRDGGSEEGKRCGSGKGGRSDHDECKWDMMRQNDKTIISRERNSLHTESGARENVACAKWQSVRGAVWCLHSQCGWICGFRQCRYAWEMCSRCAQRQLLRDEKPRLHAGDCICPAGDTCCGVPDVSPFTFSVLSSFLAVTSDVLRVRSGI